MQSRFTLSLVLALVASCSSETAPDLSVESAGPHVVGTQRFTVGARIAQAWYPAASSDVLDTSIESLEADPLRARYATLLAAAPAGCPSRTLPVTIDAAPLAGPFPLVLASHCHSCTRLSNATSAIRLASHGFIVLSIDHEGDTLWNALDGNAGSLTPEQLAGRVADLSLLLDAADTPALASADRTRIGVFGHSFGAVTAGRLAQTDARISAAAALAAPMENPLIPVVTLAEIDKPVMFVVAREDNSITELGNKFIRDNFKAAPAAAYKLEVSDAGHWSVSDLVGLVDDFKAGCGDAIRQTDDQPFTYLDPPTGRAIAASYVTAFFRATLTDDDGARAYLRAGFPAALVSAEHRD